MFVNHFLQIGHYGSLVVHLLNGLMAGKILLIFLMENLEQLDIILFFLKKFVFTFILFGKPKVSSAHTDQKSNPEQNAIKSKYLPLVSHYMILFLLRF